MIHRLILAALLVLAPQVAPAETLANQLFGAARAPSQQAPTPVGSYSRGCGAGMMELPESGPTWQAMRLSRQRNFGQPVLIDYLQDLSVAATKVGWAGLYIGDMGQPRGGPMTSGHASHQNGLDADIWMLPPKRLNLTVPERESLSSVSIRSADQKSVTGYWTQAHVALLKAAALDPRVDRIFIAAAAKIAMCQTATRKDKAWLQKIRPLYGHETHFHVRLKCPAGASLCETQTPSVAELSNGGDGCDDTLMYWVSEAYLHPPPPDPNAPKVPHVKTPREFTMADLPKQCAAVLASP